MNFFLRRIFFISKLVVYLICQSARALALAPDNALFINDFKNSLMKKSNAAATRGTVVEFNNNPVIQSNRFFVRQNLVGQNAIILLTMNYGTEEQWTNAYDHDAVYQAMCNHYNLEETKSWQKHKYFTNTRNLPAKVRDLAITDAQLLEMFASKVTSIGRKKAKNIEEGQKVSAKIAEILTEAAKVEKTEVAQDAVVA